LIVTAVVAVAGALFVIVTTAVIRPDRGVSVGKFRVRTPPMVTSPAPAVLHVVPVGQVKVTPVKANGPADTPLPERLTGVPVPVAAPMLEV
jgi:hypothetical protein